MVGRYSSMSVRKRRLVSGLPLGQTLLDSFEGALRFRSLSVRDKFIKAIAKEASWLLSRGFLYLNLALGQARFVEERYLGR